jgi:1,4-alpha-glucan branching enzyme
MKSSCSSTQVNAAPGHRVVRFELPFLEAREVFVAGTFNEWQPAMFPMSEVPGGWTTEVALAPGTHEYLFVVDGRWIADPNNPKTCPNPFGGVNSVLETAPPKPRARRANSKSKPTAP